MDYRLILADHLVRNEFLDRSDELKAAARHLRDVPGFEGLEGGGFKWQPADAIESMLEGRWSADEPALEAIIRRFTRPVYFVQDSYVTSPRDDLPSSREVG